MDSEIRFIDSTVEEENLKINENSANNLEISNQRDSKIRLEKRKDQPEIEMKQYINNLSETNVKILNKNKPTKFDKILDLVMFFAIFLFFVLFILWAMFIKERKKINIRY